MKKDEFLEQIIEELEIESVTLTLETHVREIEEWDSMGILVVRTLVNDSFGIDVKPDDFENINTVQDLIELIGTDKFSD